MLTMCCHGELCDRSWWCALPHPAVIYYLTSKVVLRQLSVSASQPAQLSNKILLQILMVVTANNKLIDL